eukprot:Protomagalhaensia_sp_Gyna_25__5105@NODE_589_length_3051_cov_94_468792_g456_i0_p1_GENE_NODE_589_length_3051_cov_94_468792_g456_i0NODE_589_length_3051_cov_94_468792_g456_i0_p1_ORF_typecomplete_len424_score47_02Actin/PF00022_19/3_1e40MreB_Mbl/PF06723_13/4e06PilM_2/PF11104_8/32PilM_2/PF11104_8/0_96_NODE_589_length_3051_cov_94_468792_g456_i05021773
MSTLVAWDFGAAFIRAAVSSNQTVRPSIVLPNAYHRQKNGKIDFGTEIPLHLATHDWMKEPDPSLHYLGLPDVAAPISYSGGSICMPSTKEASWGLQKIVLRAAKELVQVQETESTAYIFSENMLVPTTLSTALLEWMIEECRVDYVAMVASPIAALSGLGLTTGLVMDMGETHTTVTAVLEGAVMEGAVKKSKQGGRSVTDSLLRLMQSRKDYTVPPYLAYHLGTHLKECYAFVASDFHSLQTLASNTFALLQPTGVILPDGNRVCLETERFECCESLVASKHTAVELSLPHLVVDSLLPLDTDTRALVLKNLWLVGGGSHLKGLEMRFNRELKRAYHQRLQNIDSMAVDQAGWSFKDVRIKRPYNADDSVFSGTLLLGEVSIDSAGATHRAKGNFSNLWRSKAECNEEGYARVVQALRCNQ